LTMLPTNRSKLKNLLMIAQCIDQGAGFSVYMFSIDCVSLTPRKGGGAGVGPFVPLLYPPAPTPHAPPPAPPPALPPAPPPALPPALPPFLGVDHTHSIEKHVNRNHGTDIVK
jgi:hypothetical protein